MQKLKSVGNTIAWMNEASVPANYNAILTPAIIKSNGRKKNSRQITSVTRRENTFYRNCQLLIPIEFFLYKSNDKIGQKLTIYSLLKPLNMLSLTTMNTKMSKDLRN